MAIRSYRDLRVWQLSIDLAVETYHLVKCFPEDERYVLSAQARRAATSIPSNIAEGHGRIHRREYLHHLSMGRGSLNELDTDFVIAERLGFVRSDDLNAYHSLSDQVGRMLTRLHQRLRER